MSGKGGSGRNVLKRFERLQRLLTSGQATELRSAFGLPKTKQERVKIRKAATATAENAPPADEANAKGAGAAPKAPPAS